jgi:hypothetical protein
MSEYGITYTLTTPVLTLTINPTPSNTDGLYLSDLQGLDGGDVRQTIVPYPQRDGALVFDAQLNALFPTLTGFIRASTLAARTTLMDNLKGALDSIRRADGTLSWNASGEAGGSNLRSITVRLAQPVQIGQQGGIIKTFQFGLVASYPFARKPVQVGNIASIGVVSGGVSFASFGFPFSFGGNSLGSVSITPGGTVPAWPTIAISGAITYPVITNLTTGKVLALPGYTQGDGNVLYVDMLNQLVYLNGPTNSQIGYLDPATSDFWTLTNGVANNVQVSGSATSPSTSATVSWSDTYA